MKKLTIASLCALLAAAAFVAPGDAREVEEGTAFLSVMLTRGDADLIAPEEFSSGSVSAYDHSEWGGQLMYQYLMSEHWAIAPSFGIGTFNETDEPSDPGEADFEYSQSSFNIRLGVDRFVNLGDGFALFVGPGISFWSGQGKFEEAPNEAESESVTRIAIDGRIGGHVAIGETVYLSGFIGQYIGHASGEDAGAKASWSPSGTNGGMGLSFQF